jgi:hypothetical protein
LTVPHGWARDVKAEFGIPVALQQVELYDPTKVNGRALGQKYRAIFWATRQAFEASLANIPIAYPAVRLRALQRLFDKTLETENYRLAMKLLEQASRETGRLDG